MPAFFRASVWLLSVLGLLLFGWVAGSRLAYPLPLHPVEGAVIEQVARLAQDAPMYDAPSLRYVALPMMPGLPIAAAVLARAFGPELWQLRLIALLAALGLVAMTVHVLRTETRSWTIAAAGAGIFLLASGSVTGALDLGRPEPLALAFALAGFVQLRVSPRAISTLIAAVLFTCSFFVQLEMGWFALAACAYLAIEDRRRLAWFAPAVLVMCAGLYAWFAQQTSPWFTWYTWDVPLHALKMDAMSMATAMRDLMLRAFAPLTVIALLTFAMPRRPWKGPDGLWLWFLTACFGFGITASMEPWGGAHAWLPLAVGLSLFGAFAVGRVVQHLSTWPGSTRTAGASVVVTVLALQLVTVLHGSDGQVPPVETQRQWDHYRAWVRSQGNVLAPGHGLISRATVGVPTYDAYAMAQIAASPGNRVTRDDPKFFERMFDPLRKGQERPMLLTDRPLESCAPPLSSLEPGYALVRTPSDLLSWRTDDGPTLPTYLYRPVAEAPRAAVTPAPPAPAATDDPPPADDADASMGPSASVEGE